MRCLLAIAMMLFVAGCILPIPIEGGNATAVASGSAKEEPPDYNYDLLISKIISSPPNPVLSENYKSIVQVQTYGKYSPSSCHVWIVEDGEVLVDEEIQQPQIVETFIFERFANDTAPHHFTAQVRSTDLIYPENEFALGNNILSGNIQARPIGFYDVENSKHKWYYDAVGMQVMQAQAFSLKNPFNISKVGVYVQARVPPPEGAELKISLYGAQPNPKAAGLGEKIISAKASTTRIGPDPSWVYADFPRMELTNGTYWVVLEYSARNGGGIEWYRAEGNPYGEFLDTQMMDIAGWGEWEFKGFDFAFKVE
ncbi:MAG: hypothetical protein QXH30_02550 [Candidatus Bilamarchaeaceae archaeon]